MTCLKLSGKGPEVRELLMLNIPPFPGLVGVINPTTVCENKAAENLGLRSARLQDLFCFLNIGNI